MKPIASLLFAAPDTVSGNLVSGHDYRFELAPGWEIIQEEGRWKLKRT